MHGVDIVLALQAPLPSQAGAGDCIPAVQVVPPHGVPESTKSQAPAPSHVPVKPQGAAAGHMPATRGVEPAIIGEHVPTLAAVQLEQPLVQVVSQQTSSAQIPAVHPAPPFQAPPFLPLSPQWFFWRLQATPVAQSASLVHVSRQLGLVSEQAYGVQFVEV